MRKQDNVVLQAAEELLLSASSHCEILGAALSPHQTASVLAKALLRPEARFAFGSTALKTKRRAEFKLLG